jgi:uracil-DNA glycosylase family 4
VLGPTPGYHEHVHNEPFVGKPGRLLREILLAELSTLCTIYLSYLVRCGPEPDARARDYKSCYAHHDHDFRSILASHPSDQVHVLLLGADAAVQFHRLHLQVRCSHKDAMSRNGKPHQILGRTIPVFTTLHPAAVIRNNSLIHTVEDHVELLISTVRGCAPTPTDPDIQPARSPNH